MKAKLLLITLLYISCLMTGHTQSKSTFPYGETVVDGTHRVIGKNPISVSPDLVINLSASTPYTIEAVNEDSVQWFIHLKPYNEKPYTIKKDGKLLLKLGDGTVLTLTATEDSYSINLGSYRADGKYKVEKTDLEKILAKGILKWRMEIAFNEPLEKTYSDDIIGKNLKEIYQTIAPAICQKDVWSTSLSQSEWEKSKKTTEVDIPYKDFMHEELRIITHEKFSFYDLSHLFNGVGLSAFVSPEGDVKWSLTFLLSRTGWFKLKDDLFLRLGDGSVLNLPLSTEKASTQGDLYVMQVSYDLTTTEIEKIINQGILKFQTEFITDGYSTIKENTTVYCEYPNDIVGSIIRGQYQYIQNALNSKKTFNSDF